VAHLSSSRPAVGNSAATAAAAAAADPSYYYKVRGSKLVPVDDVSIARFQAGLARCFQKALDAGEPPWQPPPAGQQLLLVLREHAA